MAPANNTLQRFDLSPDAALKQLQEFTFDTPSAEESPLSDESLKCEINNFLWMHCPAGMPLGEADKLALAIFEAITESRNRYTSGASQ